MVKPSKSLVSFILVVCGWVSPVLAQQNSGHVRTYCLKITPGKASEFRQFVADATKKVAQVRANSGEFNAWYMMRAAIPAGSEATCDYMSVYVYAGFPPSDLPKMPLDATLQKADVAMDAEKFIARRNELSHLVKTELWSALEVLNASDPGNYMFINYMKVTPNGEEQWLDLERKIWKPLMEERAKRGIQKAWGVYALVLPGGTSLPYNAATVDVYSDWASIGKPQAFPEVFLKVHPGKSLPDVMATTDKAREMVRTDLYEVLEKVTPKQPAGAGSQ